MTDVHFAHPQWVHLLWLVLLYGVITVLLERRAGASLSRFVAVPMQGTLVMRTSATRRVLRTLFLLLAGLFLTLALMQPQWGLHFVTTPQVGAEIMVCLDVSKSMLAEDVSPNRLERAKAEVRDLLAYLKGDQVGLIVFAGRASVVSPLTPDFGFLRLALDQANIGSVSRGGTRLEEPIRKAIAGFGNSSDVSRSILLITDGEDQDSFPLEAAKEAAQRGIRILAIGFGDEMGSEIMMTDPKTGVRALLHDRQGAAIKSRLDGELLRKMAMLTEGAYIPAGTGVLDLESIYKRHIAGLTRGLLDGRGHSVRYDAFQWAVLLGLLSLLAAVASTTSVSSRRLGNLSIGIVWVCWLCSVSLPAMAEEQTTPAPPPTETQPELIKPPEDPRLAFNAGLESFNSGAWDEAEKSFETARSGAKTDGEVRFRATYNRAWVEVKRADALLEKEPQKALHSLHGAASWFREAIALRPTHEEGRHNLEIVLKRALLLADRLASTDKKDLLTQLNKTIEEQRGFLEQLRSSLNLAAEKQDPQQAAKSRPIFRELSARQLTLLSDGEALSEQAGQALEHIRKKEEKERSAEEGVRATQLEQMLHYLHRARERMGQARSRMRHLGAEPAFRRASAALTELKRAREVLLDPQTRLDALLADGLELSQLTGVKAALEGAVAKSTQEPAPPWLTVDYLKETQQSIQERCDVFHQGILGGLAHIETPKTAEKSDQNPPAAHQEKWVQQLKEVEPFMGQATQSFAAAQTALEGNKVADALEPQHKALNQLAAARERFLDLKGLIELAWQDENRIDSRLHVNEKVKEYLPSALELQNSNLDRAERIGAMVVMQLEELNKSTPEEKSQEERESAAKESLQRMQQANELQIRLIRQMKTARLDMERILAQASAPDQWQADLQQIQTRVEAVKQTLELLRPLFFSVVEHLKETIRRQRELNDTTQEASTLAETRPAAETAKAVGPLVSRQNGLAQITGSIGEALKKQAERLKTEAPPSPPQGGQATPAPQTESLVSAAEKVVVAQGKMSEAATDLSHSPPEFVPINAAQKQAVDNLQEALALLSPPDEQPDESKGQKHSSDPGQEKQAGEKGSPQQSPKPDADPSQLLQGIRDREAQRREAQGQPRQGAYEPVEKDW